MTTGASEWGLTSIDIRLQLDNVGPSVSSVGLSFHNVALSLLYVNLQLED